MDLTKEMHKLFHTCDSRYLSNLMLTQGRTFESVFKENVYFIFDKIRDNDFHKVTPKSLNEILMNKFEIDVCRVEYKGIIYIINV